MPTYKLNLFNHSKNTIVKTIILDCYVSEIDNQIKKLNNKLSIVQINNGFNWQWSSVSN